MNVKIIKNNREIVSCKLLFKLTMYSDKCSFVAHLDINYKILPNIPIYYNKQKINLNKECENEFVKFFNEEDLEYFKHENNVRYLRKPSLKLKSILEDLNFRKISGSNVMPYDIYDKYYENISTALETLKNIFNINTFAFKIITTQDLFDHI